MVPAPPTKREFLLCFAAESIKARHAPRIVGLLEIAIQFASSAQTRDGKWKDRSGAMRAQLAELTGLKKQGPRCDAVVGVKSPLHSLTLKRVLGRVSPDCSFTGSLESWREI